MTTPRFEDVEIGAALGPLIKGPLSAPILMRWSAAMENWHRIHYDRDFAIGHDGLPERLINGSLKQQFVVQLLKDWAGREGWLCRVAFRFRAMNSVGSTLRLWGRVRDKRELGGLGFVAIELGILDERGVESTPGQALVALPLREGQPVPYPFVAPAGFEALCATFLPP